MLQGQDASSPEDENLDFETLSPLQQPAHAAPRPDPSCLHFNLNQKALSISPLSELKAGELGLYLSSSSEEALTMLVGGEQWIPAVGEELKVLTPPWF